jgi:hypothetical protein
MATQAIPYQKSELEQLAQVSDADVAIARDMWRRYAPPLFRDLMDAPLAGTQKTRFAWDAQQRQYIYTATGRYIPPLDLRNRAIEPFLTNVRFHMRDVSGRFQSGSITLPQWQQETMQLIKYSQLASALIANGGSRNSTQTDYAQIAAMILALYLFFQGFADEIQAGKQVINGLLLSRSDLYANAGRDAYEEMRRFAMGVYGGATKERRVLDPTANHCHTQGDWVGCPELAALGWQKIGTLPRLMDTPCISNCKCHFEFSGARPGFASFLSP